MAELKAAESSEGQEEWVRLLEEDNTELHDQNRKKDEQIKSLQTEIADTKDSLSRLDYEKRSLRQRVADAERAAAALQAQANVALALEKLPQNMREVVDVLAKLYPEQIAFTEQALRTADVCTFSRVGDAWACLRAMATTLHGLFFGDEETGNLEQHFYEASGFQLSMTEGEMTKNDNKLMRLRSDSYNGTEIDITPHIRFDKDTTRAYFCPYRSGDTRLIVVGYIGHLNTAGTRRRKS
jgi:uncharacterized protein YoxC